MAQTAQDVYRQQDAYFFDVALLSCFVGSLVNLLGHERKTCTNERKRFLQPCLLWHVRRIEDNNQAKIEDSSRRRHRNCSLSRWAKVAFVLPVGDASPDFPESSKTNKLYVHTQLHIGPFPLQRTRQTTSKKLKVGKIVGALILAKNPFSAETVLTRHRRNFDRFQE